MCVWGGVGDASPAELVQGSFLSLHLIVIHLGRRSIPVG